MFLWYHLCAQIFIPLQRAYEAHFRVQFSEAFDVFLHILRIVELRMNTALRRSDPSWRLKHSCPPCTYKVSHYHSHNINQAVS